MGVGCVCVCVCVWGGGLHPPQSVFFACQYMKIPADLDPTPPLEEFLDPPLICWESADE